jgi:hypothetical protein
MESREKNRNTAIAGLLDHFVRADYPRTPASSRSCLAIVICLTIAFPKPDTFPSHLSPVRELGSRTGESLSLYERRGEEE